MSIRVKQKRKQRAAIERMAKSPLSAWHYILGRGYVFWCVFTTVTKVIGAEQDRVGFYGTGAVGVDPFAGFKVMRSFLGMDG